MNEADEEPYYNSALSYVPANPTLASLERAAAGCRACHLWRHATQTVFGDGAAPARLMLVGEQPGDKEDLAGEPFVGPSGHLLDGALEEAGIERKEVYVTNAVKHFKWIPQGGRRLHQKPNRKEVQACNPWLQAEIAVVGPDVIVCLGATAAQALLGPAFRLTHHRGEFVPSELGRPVLATLHPSAILRTPDPAARAAARESLIADLRLVATRL